MFVVPCVYIVDAYEQGTTYIVLLKKNIIIIKQW